MSSVTARLAALAPSHARVEYLLWLSRPRFWLYLAGPAAVGVVYAAESTRGLVTLRTLGLFLYFLVPANVLLYGVNDIFDADVDEENPKKADREVRYGGGRDVLVVVFTSGVLGIAVLPLLPRAAAVAMGAYLALAVAYSAPPVRFKTTPLLDSLSNGLYVLPGVVTFATVAGAFPPLWAVAGGWLWSMAMHTFSAIPDIEPDRAAGIRTTATVLGDRWSYGYCAAVWALAAATFAVGHPLLGGLVAVYPIGTMVVAVSSIAVERAYWWFPAINSAVGALFTMAGLWRLLYGG
jgi:4-hydroxybenzoate polyprenyltransferase